jgi:hypothetical protein
MLTRTRDVAIGVRPVPELTGSVEPPGPHSSTDPAIDASGDAVAFFSSAPNLVPHDSNVCFPFFGTGECPDIFESVA